MATIHDVAKLSGVSVATVSRVLNNHTNVSTKTKEKVLSAIKQLHYQPNLLGRNLRKSETRKILVLLPTISNSFYSRIVKGIEDIGNENNYNVMVCNTNSDIARERNYLELLTTKLVDGVIFMTSELSGDELTKINKQYPIVLCSEYKDDAIVSKVGIDNVKASYDAVNYLINLGHKRIALINGSTKYLSTIHREMGYKKALSDANIDINPDYIRYNSYSYKGGIRATKELLALDKKPTAIFAIADSIAIGAIKELSSNNLNVSQDVAVIGFDNTSISSMYSPSITTISQPRYDMGKTAMRLLLKKIKDRESADDLVILEHELIIRESTL